MDVARRASSEVSQPESTDAWSIADGTAVGRFLVLATVGRGATGVVVSAWDGELGRKVAIKFLAAGVGDQRARLRNEAQALARLAHPNVIKIHDVGEHDGRVYMVMEYVEGDTLVGHATPWHAIGIWIAAARGLAAAHAAGIVHGDFKPANVLLGADGRPRVSDFGHAAIDAVPIDATPERGTPITGEIGTTRSGVLVGTPAYMAPEVFEGAPADARSDQFSFCVALYEALWRVRPFEGRDVPSLAAAVTSGDLRTPPAFPVVPLRIRLAVLRGLATSPAKRFPDMNALIAALEWDPWKWPFRIAPAVVLVAIPASVIAFTGGDDVGERDYCEHIGERADARWNEERAQAIEGAFTATSAAFAADEFARARALVDEHATSLRAAEQTTCELSRSGALAPEVIGARQLCLHLAHEQLASLIDLYERADVSVVEHASDAARRLPPVEACLAEGWGPRRSGAPGDEIYALGADIARARASADAWHDASALEIANLAVARAIELDAPWLEAESHAIAARVLERDGDHTAAMPRFDAAFSAALASDHHDVAVVSALGLASLLAERGDHEDALRWVEHAEAALGRTGAKRSSLQSAVLNTRGSIAYHHGDFAAAKAAFTELLGRDVDRGERGADGVGSTLLNIGLCDANLGDPVAGLASLRESLAVEMEDHGDSHPALIRPLNAICHVEIDRGDTDAAIAACQRALDVSRADRPGAHPRLSHLWTNLGSAYFHAGDPERAEQQHLAALDNAMRTQPDDDLLIATVANNLGVVNDNLERVTEAAKYYGIAHERILRAFGPSHPSTAMVATNLAMVKVKQGDLDGAEALLTDSIVQMSARLGSDHPDLALAHAELGRIATKRGDHETAVAKLRRAYELRNPHGGDDIELADTAFGLAIALAELHGRTPEAERYATQARALYVGAGGQWADRAQMVDEWRAKTK
jgi:tetratricopeptide (TPR) repeat protein